MYGVQVGGLFAGESMFHDPERGRDASKVALVRLVLELEASGVELLDVQWLTEHLGTLGPTRCRARSTCGGCRWCWSDPRVAGPTAVASRGRAAERLARHARPARDGGPPRAGG
nr:hypothetical protein [Tessaracoccus coleopterorum]